MKIRYIKDYLRGHTDNSMNSDWTEIKAIDYQGNNIALRKTVTASSTPSWGTLDRVTDGVIEGDVSIGIASSEKQWVQVDLGEVYSIDYLHIWHYYASSRRFNDTKVEVSEDGATWTVIFDSAVEGTYDETSEGRKFKLPLEKLEENSTLSQVTLKVSDLKNEINNKRMTFKNNLIEKGISCSDDDKLSNLINKIPLLRVLSSYPIAGDNYTLYSQGSNNTNSTSFTEYGRYQHSSENGTVRVNVTFNSSSSQTSYVRIKVLRGSSEIFTNDYNNSGVGTGLSITITQDIDIQKNDIVVVYYRTSSSSRVYISSLQIKCSYPIL